MTKITVWYLVAVKQAGGTGLCTSHRSVIYISAPATQPPSRGREEWGVQSMDQLFFLLQLVSLFDPTLVLAGQGELQSNVRENNYLSLFSLTSHLKKFIKRWSAKCDKICNNSKKCPNSARKTDNMLGMALHGKNSCLHHKKHNKKFWKMILYYLLEQTQ